MFQSSEYLLIKETMKENKEMTKEEYIKTGFDSSTLEQAFVKELEQLGMVRVDDNEGNNITLEATPSICKRMVDKKFEVNKGKFLVEDFLSNNVKNYVNERIIGWLSLNTILDDTKEKLVNPVEGETMYVHPATYAKYAVELAKNNQEIKATNVYKLPNMQQTGSFVLAPNERLEYSLGGLVFSINEVGDKYVVFVRFNLQIRIGGTR